MQDFDKLRRAMVDSQLRTSDVNDPKVIRAMGAVPRERFVPNEKANVCYIDRPIPLSGTRAMNPPLVTGRLLTAAIVEESDKVLLVGAATGYTAALLAELAGRVIALESDADLLAVARETLNDRPSVSLVEGSLTEGWVAEAPYDLIVIEGAVEHIPDALINQLADRGRLVSGIVEQGVTRLGIGRKSGSAFGFSAFADCEAVVLPGFQKPRVFTF